jgi:hypothetical protein
MNEFETGQPFDADARRLAMEISPRKLYFLSQDS